MRFLAQVSSVVLLAFKSLRSRLGTSLVVVIGTAAVVGILVSALAIATSFSSAAARTGDSGRAIVMNGDTEADSSLSRENVATIMNAPMIRAAADGAPTASPEVLEFISLVDHHTGLNAYTTIRGVGPKILRLRPEIQLIDGRMFRAGAREVIVGRAAQRRLSGLQVGSTITLPNADWTVVGSFRSNGDSHESEILADAETLLNAYHRKQFSSITVYLQSSGAFPAFRTYLSANPTLNVKAYLEPEYFSNMSRPISRLLLAIAYGIGSIMALGALFSALNTMYSAISSRKTEIATLRAIGFGSTAVMASVLAESLALGTVGAILGSGLAWLLLSGTSISTMTGVTPSQMTYELHVGPGLILIGVGFSLAITAIGGIVAAIRAAIEPVSAALRSR